MTTTLKVRDLAAKALHGIAEGLKQGTIPYKTLRKLAFKIGLKAHEGPNAFYAYAK